VTTRSAPRGVVALASLVASAVLLGLALQIDYGFYNETALLLLTVAFVLAWAGTLLMRPAPTETTQATPTLRLLLALGIGVQIYVLATSRPGMYGSRGVSLDLFHAVVLLEGALIAAGVFGVRVLARLWFPGVLATSMALGIWMLTASHPPMDVIEVHETALKAFGEGRNPYAITFKNIYGANTAHYNPNAVAGDRVLFGYPYPPPNLLLAAPGQMLFGDYRYAELTALVAAAALIGWMGTSVLSKLAAALLLTTPRIFFVLEQGWTEPIALFMLALAGYCMVRRSRFAPWATGLLIVTKQYLGLALPSMVRFGRAQPDGATSFLWRAAAAGLVVTLPFAAWNLTAFVDTVVLLQTREPFRADSLSYLSWAVRQGWPAGSYVWAIAAALIALAVAMWRTPNTPAGFCASLALATFATFAFGSKAFCNYYFFVIGAICCTLGAALSQPQQEASRMPFVGAAGGDHIRGEGTRASNEYKK
jgi:hypothetical protein